MRYGIWNAVVAAMEIEDRGGPPGGGGGDSVLEWLITSCCASKSRGAYQTQSAKRRPFACVWACALGASPPLAPALCLCLYPSHHHTITTPSTYMHIGYKL
jgi:hypothetical protein